MSKHVHIKHFRHSTSQCPKCLSTVDTATTDKAAEPKPGSIAICWKCLAINVYDENLQIQAMTPEQIKTLEQDPILWKQIQAVISQLSQMRKK